MTRRNLRARRSALKRKDPTPAPSQREQSSFEREVIQITSGPTARLVSPQEVRTDGGTQPREQMATETIEEYAANMRFDADLAQVVDAQQKAWPAIEVVEDDDGALWLVDGFHRVAAARRAGVEHFQAEVSPGTRRDAILKSLGVNARHGLRRSRRDLRRAIDRALKDEEWGQFTDSRIARLCHTTSPTVSKRRQLLERRGAIPFYELLRAEDGREFERERPADLAPAATDAAPSEAAIAAQAEEAARAGQGGKAKTSPGWHERLRAIERASALIVYPESAEDWRALARWAPAALGEGGVLVTPLYSGQRALLTGLGELCGEGKPFGAPHAVYVEAFDRMFLVHGEATRPAQVDVCTSDPRALLGERPREAVHILGAALDGWEEALAARG